MGLGGWAPGSAGLADGTGVPVRVRGHSGSVGAGAGGGGVLRVGVSCGLQRKRLGGSGLSVSEVTLGTMTWGKQNSEADAHAQLDVAFGELGINAVDTAELYPVPPQEGTAGRTDLYLGSWLRGQRRDDVVLMSKVSGYAPHLAYLRDAGVTTRLTEEQMRESVDKSLARLGTDYLDVLQLHWPDRYVPMFGQGTYRSALAREDAVGFEEQLVGLGKLVEAGKLRHVGLSNETPYGLMRFLQVAREHGLPVVSSVQNAYNLLVRADEGGLAEVLHNTDTAYLAYSPLAGGMLTGKYARGEVDGARLSMFDNYMVRYKGDLAREATGRYAEVARRHGMTPTQLALSFVASRDWMTSVIVGATSVEQLRENVDAVANSVWNEEVERDVDEVYARFRDPTTST